MITIEEFYTLVEQMREQQKLFFKYRNMKYVTTSKELEKQVDKVIAERKKGQSDLFQPSTEYEYEIFIESEESDHIKMDGWFPITKSSIKHPDRIERYIASGLLRRKK